jgi:hypothetical protein
MPPLQALVALHGLWFLVLLPPAVWAARRWPAPRLRVVGSTLVAIGALGLVIVAAREAVTWLPSLPDDQACYFPHRVAYVVATLTDVPLTQVALAGIVCWIVGRLRPTRGRLVSTGHEPTCLEPAAARDTLATPSSRAPAVIPLADDASPQRLPEPSGE